MKNKEGLATHKKKMRRDYSIGSEGYISYQGIKGSIFSCALKMYNVY